MQDERLHEGELLYEPDKAVYCTRTGRVERDRGYVDDLTCQMKYNRCTGTHYVLRIGETVKEYHRERLARISSTAT